MILAVVLVAAGGGMIYTFGWGWAPSSANARFRAGPEEGDELQEAEDAPVQVRVQFAEDRVGGGEAKPADFDGKRAMSYLEAVCDIGPRQSGTPGMKKQIDLLHKHFQALNLPVAKQTFMARQIGQTTPIEMTNLIVSIHPDRKRRVIICSHYDTRPIADQEPDPRKWREKFLSANDGGSGVACLMEMAHHLGKLQTTVGVDLVFFDGEEYIFVPRRDEYFFGSKHFAKTWKKSKDKNRPDYIAAFLLDMIAGKNAKFPVEGYSWARAEDLCKSLWKVADEQKADAFLNRLGEHRVLDDHIALLDVGIPAIDIIDFDYPHWHRLSDTPQNCSPDSMAQVARVLSVWLQRVR